MGLKDNSECALCKEEDVEHLVLRCPLQDRLRENLAAICQAHDKRSNIKDFLTVTECISVISDSLMHSVTVRKSFILER